MRRKRRNNSTAKKCSYDGVDFKSKLEMYCYKALKREGIPSSYEKRSIQILPPIVDKGMYFKSYAKKKVSAKTNKVQGVLYTPDFEDNLNNAHYGFFIETKGRANEAFPMRIKLFRHWRSKNEPHKEYYQAGNEAEVEQVIQIIKQNL